MTSRLALPILRQAVRRSAPTASAAAASTGSTTAAQAHAVPAIHSAVPAVPSLFPAQFYYYSTTPSPKLANSDGDSHSDFAPQRKSVPSDDADDESIQDMIRDHVTSNRIMLYMKGTPSMPMCGFSARVVGALQEEGVNFSSVNVLDYPSVREGVKKYAQWPTIPQLYVDGEFIGGCDIVLSMSESGELSEILKEGEGGGEEKK